MTETKKKEESVSAAEAAEIVRQAREADLRRCDELIKKALQECRCELVAVPALTPDGRIVVPRIGLRLVPEQQ